MIYYEDFNEKDFEYLDDGTAYNYDKDGYSYQLYLLKGYIDQNKIVNLSRIVDLLKALVDEFEKQEEICDSLDEEVFEYITKLVEQKNKELENK